MSRRSWINKRTVLFSGGAATLCLLLVGFWPMPRTDAHLAAARANEYVVKRGDLKLEITATGSLMAKRAVDIGPPYVEGLWDFKIARLIPEGTRVKPGEVLVEFDEQEVNRLLTEQRAEMEKAQEELTKRKLEYDVQLRDLRVRLEEANVNLQKAKHKADVDTSLTSMLDYRQAQIELEKAESEVKSLARKLEATETMLKAELAALENRLENAQIRVKRLEQQKGALKVTAPTAGIVIYRRDWNGQKKSVGQSVWRLETIMQIPDLSTLQMEVMVEESDAGTVATGQRAQIRLDAFPELQLRGRLTTVGTILRVKRPDMPVKVIDAVIALDRGEGRLLPGMTAAAIIEVKKIPNALLVPLRAVREKGGRAVVSVAASSGKPEERSIQVGRRNSEFVEVVKGLREGERIVI